MNCLLKTEMFTQMQRVMPGGFNLKIAEVIDYAKKPGKMQIVKVIKDSPHPVDFYKSGAVHTQQGEPPTSVSRPTPKGKPVPPRPITRGKLIKPGGPGGRPSRLTGGRRPQPRPGAGSVSRPTPQPAAIMASAAIPSHTRSSASQPAVRQPPPPPPPPAAAPAKPKMMAKVLYDFSSTKENELSVTAGEMIEIVQKENNGKPLVPFSFLRTKAEATVETNLSRRLVARKVLSRPSLGPHRLRRSASSSSGRRTTRSAAAARSSEWGWNQ
jgi:myosin-1